MQPSRNPLRWLSILLSLSLIFSSLTVLAQDKQDKKDRDREKETKKKQKSAREEKLEKVYERWMNEDVAWIITDEEKKTFKALKTDEEREQFIEQFWLRRDPDPDTDVNEYREEYYQRIAYANEHYTSGIPGWKTDRGRIYIMFGKPDEIESHPSGGSYDRPTWEGGGTTSTYPFEIWWYRYIEGVGSDVEIEFVDPTGSGEYRIARSPNEKDALLYVPNAGLTLAEQLGLSSKADRIAGYSSNGQNGQLFGTRAKDQPFERLELLSKLQRAPRVKFNDLAGIASGSEYPRVSQDVLPAHLRVDFQRVTENAVIASFTIQMDNQDLVYKDKGGIQEAAVNIYARITGVSGRRAGLFEDVVTSQYTTEQVQAGVQNVTKSVYSKRLTLPPGNYKIDLVVRDVNSGKTAVIPHGFVVPKYPEGELSASTLVLASRLEPLNGRLPTSQFDVGSLKVIPNASGNFRTGQTLGVYMQVYNVQIDQATLRPSVDVEYVIKQGDKEVARYKEDGRNSLSSLNSQQITLGRLIPLKDLKEGSYHFSVIVTDKVAGKTISRDESFQIIRQES
jgi:GWxTD domain-containing protein